MPSRPAAAAALRLLAIVTALLPLASPLRAEPRLIERVLAVVNGTPILFSDVQLVERLHGRSPAEALELVIDERLMYEEAVRLGPSRLGPTEEQAAFQSLKQRWPEASQGEEASLRRSARRQASILKYIELRFRPQIQAAARRAVVAPVAQSREPGNSEPVDSALPPAAAETADDVEREREALDQRLEVWIRELRAAAQIRRTEP